MKQTLNSESFREQAAQLRKLSRAGCATSNVEFNSLILPLSVGRWTLSVERLL
jgi:hypothetical protein